MPFQLSPGVAVVEKDFTSIVPAVSSSAGAFAGVFQWGPVLEPITITSENELVSIFGKPTDSNFQSFFTAANFLSYTNNLLVCRADTAATNAVSSGTSIKIKNNAEYLTSYSTGQGTVGEWAARYPGALGNSLKVSMADAGSFTNWAYADQFEREPGTSSAAAAVGGGSDEMHVIIVDEDGLWSGTAGTILEKYSFLSKASDSKTFDGSNNYYKDAINSKSKFIYWMDHTTIVGGSNWGGSLTTTFNNLTSAVTRSLTGGTDDLTATAGELQTAWIVFADDSQYDISLLPLGPVTATVAAYVINNVAEVRKDCVVFASVADSEGAVILTSDASAVTKATAYRDALPSTSYGVCDSGYKYQYDRYNDKYRYVPLNGDTAGTCARTDYTNDPWFSPAGLNRGQIKNVVKLAFNPNKTQRDLLYKDGINPVVSFPGQGTVLFGDKTLLAKPSAFDRINVRRLFIVLEKAIATASKFQLFEFNDEFTRAQFKNLVEPFLRDVQGRRGITDFLVKCDATNNTGEVIDRNEFIGDIFIKPARSINFITLNFIAARTSVNFNEIGG